MLLAKGDYSFKMSVLISHMNAFKWWDPHWQDTKYLSTQLLVGSNDIQLGENISLDLDVIVQCLKRKLVLKASFWEMPHHVCLGTQQFHESNNKAAIIYTLGKFSLDHQSNHDFLWRGSPLSGFLACLRSVKATVDFTQERLYYAPASSSAITRNKRRKKLLSLYSHSWAYECCCVGHTPDQGFFSNMRTIQRPLAKWDGGESSRKHWKYRLSREGYFRKDLPYGTTCRSPTQPRYGTGQAAANE